MQQHTHADTLHPVGKHTTCRLHLLLTSITTMADSHCASPTEVAQVTPLSEPPPSERDCHVASFSRNAYICGYGLSHPPLISNVAATAEIQSMMRAGGCDERLIERSSQLAGMFETRALGAARFHQGETKNVEFCGKLAGEYSKDEVLEPGYVALNRAQINRTWWWYASRMVVEAGRNAIDSWGGDKNSITHVITTATTGWVEPGLASELINKLELPMSTSKQELNYNGCFCSLTCARLARDIVLAGRALGETRVVLVVGVENASVMTQGAEVTPNDVIVQSLFSDGAAAFIISNVAPKREPSFGRWSLNDAGGSLVPNSTHLLGMSPVSSDKDWKKREAVEMRLNPGVGEALGKHFSSGGQGATLIKHTLDRHGFRPSESGGGADCLPSLAVHPGGPRILDSLKPIFAKEFGFGKDAFDHSYATMRKFGNLGCTAILFVVARAFEELEVKKKQTSHNAFNPSNAQENNVLALAFGPGVTVEWAIFRRVPDHAGESLSPARPSAFVETPTQTCCFLPWLPPSVDPKLSESQSTDSTDSLDQLFSDACTKLKSGFLLPTQSDQLRFYGLFKQAMSGDNQTKQPWAVQIAERAKWEAWTKNKGLSATDAKRAYLALFQELAAGE